MAPDFCLKQLHGERFAKTWNAGVTHCDEKYKRGKVGGCMNMGSALGMPHLRWDTKRRPVTDTPREGKLQGAGLSASFLLP